MQTQRIAAHVANAAENTVPILTSTQGGTHVLLISSTIQVCKYTVPTYAIFDIPLPACFDF